MSDAGTQQTRLTRLGTRLGAALALGLALAALAAMPSPAQAATFTVTNTDDAGPGSLRQAIEDANAAAGADVIQFQIPTLPDAIVLFSGELLVTDSVDIQGPGAPSLVVTGNTSLRVFNIENGQALIDVTISGLTISGGSAIQGAGILDNGENLTLNRVVLTGSSATSDGGGLWVGGPATSVTLQDSTVSGNTADRDGGGIYVEGMDGTLLIEQTTVSGNLAGRNGGGIYFAAPSAEVTIAHSTIAGNFTTLEGGGIYASGISVTLDQTIAGDNMTTVDNDLANDSDGSFDARFSLIEFPGTANLNDNGGNVLNQDPQLGPLTNNGGPTPTHLPALTSPAVNAGDPAFVPPPATDQRGLPRVVSGRIDIGSVELGAGTVQFSEPTYTVFENVGTATITVTRTGGSAGAVSVNYQTSDGTATQPGDYLPAAGTLNWADGDLEPKTFQVTIVNDPDVESGETVILTLSAPQGAALGSPSMAELTILDNDQPTSIQFSEPTYTVFENVVTATITVTRTGGSEGAVSVNYQTSDGTATQPGDYLPAAGTLNWADGDLEPKTFQVTIVDDPDVEGSETVILTLSAPQGATLGSPSTAELTILDNDQPTTMVPGIPTLGDAGKVLFAGLCGLAALLLLRRRRLGA